MSSSEKLWRAYCTDCECVTDMRKTDTPKEAICLECDKLQIVGQNPRKLQEMRALAIEAENLFANFLRVNERIKAIERTLDPVEVTPKPKWERLVVEMACHECDRKTRHAFNNLPHCYPKCKPRPGKVGVEDVPEVAAMLREFMEGTNDDNDYEVMKFRTPEAS